MPNTLEELCSWSVEDAIKAQKGWKDDRLSRPPLLRWQGAQNLKALQKIYLESENPAVIPEALYFCSLNDFSIPEWCAYAYLQAFRKVRHYKAGSWDEVFGRPHPKGTHLGSRRQRREKEFEAYNMISDIKRTEPDTPIDGYLFEKVGRKLGIGGKTLTEEYYYGAKKYLEEVFPKST